MVELRPEALFQRTPPPPLKTALRTYKSKELVPPVVSTSTAARLWLLGVRRMLPPEEEALPAVCAQVNVSPSVTEVTVKVPLKLLSVTPETRITCPTCQKVCGAVCDRPTVTTLLLRLMLEMFSTAWATEFISTESMNSHRTLGPMCTAGPEPMASENDTSNEKLRTCTAAAPALPAPLPLESRPIRK